MKIEKIELSEANAFSPGFLNYLGGKPELRPFYTSPPSIESFAQQLKDRNFPHERRQVLVTALEKQYGDLDRSEAVTANIEALRQEDTFTVTTGHQLNIFTGPLYFLYKIVTVIRMAEELGDKYPGNTFVPVYWMASEDHDFDEISYFRFAGKKYQWETDQTGAVGRFDPSGLKTILDEFPAQLPLFRKAYMESDDLAGAVRYYVNELFGQYGVVVIDADDRELKKELAPVMEADIFDHVPMKEVDTTNRALEEAGLKTQVHAREINFFYLDEGQRERLEERDGDLVLVDSGRSFSKADIKKLISEEPEKFSPNVILRPLYQEIILPNLAYVGGPAEVVYWLQLKGVFDQFNVPFPVVMPRNFGLIIPAHTRRKWDKTGLELKDLFLGRHELEKHITLKYTEHELRLNGKSYAVEETFKGIREQAAAIDSTLGPMVEAETARAMRSLEKIEKKMIRAEKRRMSERIGQAQAVQDDLMPGGGLQERTDNFLNFWLDDPELVDKLVASFDPFDLKFHIFSYE